MRRELSLVVLVAVLFVLVGSGCGSVLSETAITPSPTNTSQPTATWTPEPTSTRTPTQIPAATAIATSSPTPTSEPTPTPEPTATEETLAGDWEETVVCPQGTKIELFMEEEFRVKRGVKTFQMINEELADEFYEEEGGFAEHIRIRHNISEDDKEGQKVLERIEQFLNSNEPQERLERVIQQTVPDYLPNGQRVDKSKPVTLAVIDSKDSELSEIFTDQRPYYKVEASLDYGEWWVGFADDGGLVLAYEFDFEDSRMLNMPNDPFAAGNEMGERFALMLASLRLPQVYDHRVNIMECLEAKMASNKSIPLL